VGQGRVWTGSQALERGLVDKMGLLQDAVASAAKRANLGDAPSVKYVEAERSTIERLVSGLTESAAPTVRAEVLRALGGVPQLPAPLKEAQTDITWLAEQAQPDTKAGGTRAPVKSIVHCLCLAP